MKILAIDTATEVCSVAILEDKDVILEKTLEAVNTHSVSLMPLIKEVLFECKLNINDIDLFACDKGPGSFTGIRIGLSTIKAFCDVTNKSCIGVTSLEGFAYKLFDIFNIDFADELSQVKFASQISHATPPLQEYYICSLLNANHGNAYCGVFYFDNDKLIQVQDYCFDSIKNILDSINKLEKSIFFVGNCGKFLLDVIKSNKNDAWKICEANFTRNNLNDKISATDVGRCAFDKFSSGNYEDSNSLTPLYLKQSSAESKGTD